MLLARPAWITVDLGAIQHNLRAIKARLRPSTKVLAVIKAHAYGHGAVQVAKAVIDAGADLLGVTGLDEAIELRNSGITAGILMLGYTPPWQASTVVANSIAVSVFDPDLLEPLERAARLLERPAIIHLKVDTGMGRLGPSIDHFAELCQRTRLSPHIVVDGIFTHLATADAEDDRFTHEQLQRFRHALYIARQNEIFPHWIHAANSAALLRYAESHFNLVRPGAALYGLDPSSATPCPPDFKSALSFQALVAQVKMLPAGATVSYGATWMAQRPSRIAVIQAGYADGIRRSPYPWKHVLIQSHCVEIVGAICMDMCMADVTDIPNVHEGDIATFIGIDGDEHLSVSIIASELKTVGYEVLCGLASRIPRIYLPSRTAGTAVQPPFEAEPLVQGVRTI